MILLTPIISPITLCIKTYIFDLIYYMRLINIYEDHNFTIYLIGPIFQIIGINKIFYATPTTIFVSFNSKLNKRYKPNIYIQYNIIKSKFNFSINKVQVTHNFAYTIILLMLNSLFFILGFELYRVL